MKKEGRVIEGRDLLPNLSFFLSFSLKRKGRRDLPCFFFPSLFLSFLSVSVFFADSEIWDNSKRVGFIFQYSQ